MKVLTEIFVWNIMHKIRRNAHIPAADGYEYFTEKEM